MLPHLSDPRDDQSLRELVGQMNLATDYEWMLRAFHTGGASRDAAMQAADDDCRKAGQKPITPNPKDEP